MQQHWRDAEGERLAAAARRLQAGILRGVQEYGTTRTADGRARVYCYEVDGLGGCKVAGRTIRGPLQSPLERNRREGLQA